MEKHCFKIVIPVNYNSGNKVPDHVVQDYLTEASEICGGATLHPQAFGYWGGGAGTCREPVRVLETIGDFGDYGALYDLALRIKRELKQEAVLLTYHVIEAEFV